MVIFRFPKFKFVIPSAVKTANIAVPEDAEPYIKNVCSSIVPCISILVLSVLRLPIPYKCVFAPKPL